MNRDACYSPWSFSSWPAASLVKTPVSNDPCQRLPRTYHTSSLVPHTDNYNHTYSPFATRSGHCCDKLMRRRGVSAVAKRGGCCSIGEEPQYRCSSHRISFFAQVIVHSPSCPLKSHILPCLAKEHFLSAWLLSLPSCFLQWGGLSCHPRCVKPSPL